jgi:hypothetical protein
MGIVLYNESSNEQKTPIPCWKPAQREHKRAERSGDRHRCNQAIKVTIPNIRLAG